MTNDLGVWTADDCALALIGEVPKLTDAVGVASAEKRAASAHGGN